MEKFSFLSNKEFRKLVEGLTGSFTVYGTVRKDARLSAAGDGFPAYGRISCFEDLVLGLTPTHLSAKEFLFPQRETLLKFDIEKMTHAAVVEAVDQVIIGLHPCDIHAVGLMDRVFAYGKPDVNYLARRAKTVIIGTDCMPDRFCFCKSVDTMNVDAGFDIFLHRVKGVEPPQGAGPPQNGFLVRTATDRGKTILSKYAKAKKASLKQLDEIAAFEKKREDSFTAHIDAPAGQLPEIYSKSDESPVWERIGAICYGCGSCNNVCPTCYCFDVKDEMKSNLNEGERVRVWDGCTLEDFAKVTGGHNFRRTRSDRLRHRFNRKFNYLTGRFGALFCVGCGRCSRTCLVQINISEVTNELIREYNAKKRQ
ncbi:MAG: 4Fe-4S dicluster domain-containing protein [Deltaproteobacteria bacterium]|nr:4Fe-4S dicluster domain-containing protein [Deltaproteobacteria bacterium]